MYGIMSAFSATTPKVVYNSQHIAKGLSHIASGILSNHPAWEELAFIGIHTGGDLLLRRIIAELIRLSGRDKRVDMGLLDISFYRDDWSRLSQVPSVQETVVPFVVDDRPIILVDDVIFTGRTVRSAMEGIFSLGRPKSVELAVLVDRGHREMPIQPDYPGLILPTTLDQSVNVFIHEQADLDHAILEDHKYKVG